MPAFWLAFCISMLHHQQFSSTDVIASLCFQRMQLVNQRHQRLASLQMEAGKVRRPRRARLQLGMRKRRHRRKARLHRRPRTRTSLMLNRRLPLSLAALKRMGKERKTFLWWRSSLRAGRQEHDRGDLARWGATSDEILYDMYIDRMERGSSKDVKLVPMFECSSNWGDGGLHVY